MSLTDIEIANSVEPKSIVEIAAKAGIKEENVIQYGPTKAKISLKEMDESAEQGKLVLVTAISPTPAGEGKTTVSVGLADAFSQLGKNAFLAVREPSLGPVFGVKGGAAGGGYSQVIPMEDINLHFTGDLHAIGAANNLLAALLDNHIHQGNALNIDTRNITWKRAIDMNDRQLRNIVDGLEGRSNGFPREDHFEITVASEIMAVLCLSNNIAELKENLGNIIVAYSTDKKPVTAADLKAQGAMAALLKDAIQPNLVQTLNHTPAFIHGGPFANIAHGCNSIIATKLALQKGDYVITEAGFAADLGAEKFIDIKCRRAGIQPDAVVLVATCRALKSHGGVAKADLNNENVEALKAGFSNMDRHIKNMKNVFGLDVVVAINKFPSDTEAEIQAVHDHCDELGVKCSLADVWAKGGEGGQDLAKKLIEVIEKGEAKDFKFAYELEDDIETKLNKIVKNIYHGDGIELTKKARRQLKDIEELGYGNLPICMAKTQYSFSDDASLNGAPEGFTVTIRNLELRAGAGFIVALTGNIMTMPGLPKVPAAENIDLDDEGNITGLF